jgi:hypothetical protein
LNRHVLAAEELIAESWQQAANSKQQTARSLPVAGDAPALLKAISQFPCIQLRKKRAVWWMAEPPDDDD